MSEPPPAASPLARALGAFGVALLAAGGAVWVALQIPWPWVLDINSPDFSLPALFVIALAGAAVWFTGSGVLWLLRARSFGTARLVLDGGGPGQLGGILSGRVLCDRPVAATGPFRLVLTCHDVHEFGVDNGEPRRVSTFPVWSAETTLPPGTDAQEGLPFRFRLPETVGPDPVSSGIVPGGGNRWRLTIHVPGMRRVAGGNTPPVGRFWTLDVTAPTGGLGFRARLEVPVRP